MILTTVHHYSMSRAEAVGLLKVLRSDFNYNTPPVDSLIRVLQMQLHRKKRDYHLEFSEAKNLGATSIDQAFFEHIERWRRQQQEQHAKGN